MDSFRIKVFLIYIFLFVLGLWAMISMISLKVTLGKYYRGEGIPTDSSITIDGRTFSFEYSQEESKRGNIYAQDGTILLTSIYIYDLYWYPSKVMGKDSALFMEKVDSLIDIFYEINPSVSKQSYKKNIKERYLSFRKEYHQARLQAGSKDKIQRKKGLTRLAELDKERHDIRVSKIDDSQKWVRQKHVNAIDRLFSDWKGEKSYRGGCQKDKRFVRRQLSGGFPNSVLGRFTTKPSRIRTDSMVFNNGIEGYCNKDLAGISIPKRILKVNNYTIRLRENRHLKAENGKDVFTTIDTDIQRITKSALERKLTGSGANWGCAVVMEVSTGEIKAISNLNLDPKTGSYQENSDHSMVERYEPGSTFKLLTLIAALESGNIDTGTIVRCDKDSNSLARAFEISDNSGLFNAAKIAYGNIESFGLGLAKLGLNVNLKLEVSNAKRPRLGTKTKSKTDFENITHGYSVSIPPMYMLAYYNAIANGGRYVKPRLIKSIRNPNLAKNNVETFEPVIIKPKICSDRTLFRVQKCLEGVVTHGTGRRIRDDQYFNDLKDSTVEARPLIAGKTGTAFIFEQGQYGEKKNSSFIGYFPSEAPKYTCLVLISGTTLDASAVAAPVCKEIAEKLITHLNDFERNKKEKKNKAFPTCAMGNFEDLSTIYEQLGIRCQYENRSGLTQVVEKNGSPYFISLQKPSKPVGNLQGANAKDAVYLLEKAGYKTFVRGRGKVQRIEYKGKTAFIYLNN